MSSNQSCASHFVRRMCVGVCISAVALSVVAETAGAGEKKTIGTVVSLEAGDVACYVSLKDDQGVAFDEIGDFFFCEQPSAWVGKRVKLTYAIQKVLADECQGNPDCTVFKEEAAIANMEVIVASAGQSAPAH